MMPTFSSTFMRPWILQVFRQPRKGNYATAPAIKWVMRFCFIPQFWARFGRKLKKDIYESIAILQKSYSRPCDISTRVFTLGNSFRGFFWGMPCGGLAG